MKELIRNKKRYAKTTKNKTDKTDPLANISKRKERNENEETNLKKNKIDYSNSVDFQRYLLFICYKIIIINSNKKISNQEICTGHINYNR